VQTKRILTITLAAVTLATRLTFAESNQAHVKDLKAAKQRVQAAAFQTKGLPRSLLDMERVRLANLIDDLEQGKRVDPSEIDQALDRAEQLERAPR